jgi:hypothetical protein
MYIKGTIIIGTFYPLSDFGFDREEFHSRYFSWAKDDQYGDGNGNIETPLTPSEFFQDYILEDGTHGWKKLYHGSSMEPIAFIGVEIKELDECEHVMNIDKVFESEKYYPQMEKAISLYRSIPEEISAMLPPFGVHLIWSSS